jgi:hypothetical protein
MIGKGETVNGYELNDLPAVEIQMANIFFITLFAY